MGVAWARARRRSPTGARVSTRCTPTRDWTTTGAYVYSPAFLQLIAPLKALPWVAFLGVWTAILLVAVRYLTGPRLFAIGVLLAAAELAGGNISLLLAVAIVVGFRWPAVWALILLTKVSPGIGLLWFAVRREWRNLGIALGATAAVIAVSAVIMPGAWLEWLNVLTSIAGRDPTWAAVPIPLIVRLPFAVAVVVWGALTDRRWTVPVACMLALPALWYGGLTMLLAVIILRQPDLGRPVRERAAGRRGRRGRLRTAPVRTGPGSSIGRSRPRSPWPSPIAAAP